MLKGGSFSSKAHSHHFPAPCSPAQPFHRCKQLSSRWRPRLHNARAAESGEVSTSAPTTTPCDLDYHHHYISRRSALNSAVVGTAGAASALLALPGAAAAAKLIQLADGKTVEAFEHAQSLSIVTLRGSVPSQWIMDFRAALGRYAGFSFDQRAQIEEIFKDLPDVTKKRSAGAAAGKPCSTRTQGGAALLLQPLRQSWFACHPCSSAPTYLPPILTNMLLLRLKINNVNVTPEWRFPAYQTAWRRNNSHLFQAWVHHTKTCCPLQASRTS